ncbi:hypothetical protein D9611_002027 [Ephemerocybe angulata]|uniref:Pre-mRNA-splicing factor CWC2 n=1 Tax=Ephemerocybe angulata TaxID=980116 RepID=A0A8H5CJ08_9AGAR|nr:hypothetical protein D9611_002027 [Tulosesus angulatus]
MSEVATKTLPVQPRKKQKKLKPARKQVKPGDVVKTEAVQTGKEYNIWYNKWAGGDREDNYSNKVKSQTRCNIKRDAGLTRANTTGNKYTCLFFARGCCPYGWECEYRHTIPDPEDVLPDTSKDCFARDKFADYRDDMGGVGSFNRQNRTLYIGRIKECASAAETEEVIIRHFKEWGPIEKIRILQYRSVAFVTYTDEFAAQFAKEAMACQSLDNDEILNVRWATEDPNPESKQQEKRRLEEMGQEAIRERMDPRIVDAMRAVRALEEGVDPNDAEYEVEEMEDEEEDEQEDGRQTKRRRMEIEDVQPQQQQPQALGILSADTIESLKYFAEIRQRTGATPVPVVKKALLPAAPKPAGLGLADYGSDDDDE